MKARKPKIAKPAITGAWQSHLPYDDPDVDEVILEVSRLQSRLNRGLRPSDIIQLMKRLGWKKSEGTT